MVGRRPSTGLKSPLMCGRASTTTPLEQIGFLVGAQPPYPAWRPRYNQPPGEPIANVIESNGERRIESFVWGIKGRDPKRPFINVRAESVIRSRAFAAGRRALFFVDGFYEWDKQKQPYYFTQQAGGPIALATVYDESPDQARCAVITTTANELAAKIHNRLPLIVTRESWDAWLDPACDASRLTPVLKPISSSFLKFYPVAKLVNSPRNDRPELIQELGASERFANLAQQVRERFERSEFTTGDVARELGIDDDEAERLLLNMPGLDRRLAKWWFRKASR